MLYIGNEQTTQRRAATRHVKNTILGAFEAATRVCGLWDYANYQSTACIIRKVTRGRFHAIISYLDLVHALENHSRFISSFPNQGTLRMRFFRERDKNMLSR